MAVGNIQISQKSMANKKEQLISEINKLKALGT